MISTCLYVHTHLYLCMYACTLLRSRSQWHWMLWWLSMSPPRVWICKNDVQRKLGKGSLKSTWLHIIWGKLLPFKKILLAGLEDCSDAIWSKAREGDNTLQVASVNNWLKEVCPSWRQVKHNTETLRKKFPFPLLTRSQSNLQQSLMESKKPFDRKNVRSWLPLTQTSCTKHASLTLILTMSKL